MEEFFDYDAQPKYPDALQLTRVKALLIQKTVWKTDEYDDEKPLLVDDHNPIRFTINWCRETEKRHPNQYAVNKRINKGESWTWVTRFFNEPKEVADYLIETKLCEGKMDKEQFFESLLNETQIEVFPQNGKLQARGIGDKVVSSKTHNKMSGLDTQATTLPLGRNQLAGTKAVIAYLKSKNKLNDIANEFDTDPRPDITFNPTGDAIITPDGGNGKPYTIPAAEIEPFYESISDYKGHMLLGAAVLGVGALSAIDHNKVKSTADKLGIELAETEYSSHEAAGLVGPIYEYKYNMKGPMNIDSLCEYLKDHTDFDKISYEDGGDHYIINYIDNYTTHQKAGNATVTKHRTSKGNLNLPKSYFDASFVLDESKAALFDKLLEE